MLFIVKDDDQFSLPLLAVFGRLTGVNSLIFLADVGKGTNSCSLLLPYCFPLAFFICFYSRSLDGTAFGDLFSQLMMGFKVYLRSGVLKPSPTKKD